MTLTVYDPPAQPRPFSCPTKWELWHQIIAIGPRGRAHQTDVAPQVELDTGPVDGHELSVMHRYWAAYASLLEYFHQRACALLDEFACHTMSETRDWWLADYGFPDDCEIYDDICAKVSARGGATCAYLRSVAASRGWLISCSDCVSYSDDDVVGLADVCSGHVACACPPGSVFITVFLASSPAYVGVEDTDVVGLAEVGCTTLACPPAIDSLVCLIERIKPAHVRPVFVTI